MTPFQRAALVSIGTISMMVPLLVSAVGKSADDMCHPPGANEKYNKEKPPYPATYEESGKKIQNLYAKPCLDTTNKYTVVGECIKELCCKALRCQTDTGETIMCSSSSVGTCTGGGGSSGGSGSGGGGSPQTGQGSSSATPSNSSDGQGVPGPDKSVLDSLFNTNPLSKQPNLTSPGVGTSGDIFNSIRETQQQPNMSGGTVPGVETNPVQTQPQTAAPQSSDNTISQLQPPSQSEMSGNMNQTFQPPPTAQSSFSPSSEANSNQNNASISDQIGQGVRSLVDDAGKWGKQIQDSLADLYSGKPTVIAQKDALTTFYAPGAGGRIEGGWETSRPNLEGEYVPKTLDDVRLGKSDYATLASDPSNYGKYYQMGSVTYTSPIDGKTYTGDQNLAASGKATYSDNLANVTGYVNDTGSAFTGRPDKFDVAAGDFRGWSASQGSQFVDAQPYGQNVVHSWNQVSGLAPGSQFTPPMSYADARSYFGISNTPPSNTFTSQASYSQFNSPQFSSYAPQGQSVVSDANTFTTQPVSSQPVDVRSSTPSDSSAPAPASTDNSSDGYNFSQSLSQGMSGEAVKQLQQFLISQGYKIASGATGYFGDQTLAAVKAFQRDNYIAADGIVGRQTRIFLNGY